MASQKKQAFARGSFFEGIFLPKCPSFFARIVLFALLEPCERRRSAMASLRLSRLSLYHEEYLILWRGITTFFYFLHTVRAQGVKTHAVLCVDEVFTKL